LVSCIFKIEELALSGHSSPGAPENYPKTSPLDWLSITRIKNGFSAAQAFTCAFCITELQPLCAECSHWPALPDSGTLLSFC